MTAPDDPGQTQPSLDQDTATWESLREPLRIDNRSKKWNDKPGRPAPGSIFKRKESWRARQSLSSGPPQDGGKICCRGDRWLCRDTGSKHHTNIRQCWFADHEQICEHCFSVQRPEAADAKSRREQPEKNSQSPDRAEAAIADAKGDGHELADQEEPDSLDAIIEPLSTHAIDIVGPVRPDNNIAGDQIMTSIEQHLDELGVQPSFDSRSPLAGSSHLKPAEDAARRHTRSQAPSPEPAELRQSKQPQKDETAVDVETDEADSSEDCTVVALLRNPKLEIRSIVDYHPERWQSKVRAGKQL